METQSRLDRIEDKLDRLTEAMIQMARTDEKGFPIGTRFSFL